MKLTIFGATGGTGRQLTEQALAAGHDVTAVVRDPARLAVARSPRLHVITADVLDPAAIVPAVDGADAVATAIGPRGNGPTTLSQDSVRSIIQAMHKAGTRRLLTVSGSVVTDEGEGPLLRYLVKPLARRTALRHVCADMRSAEAEVIGSGLDDRAATPADRPAGHRAVPHRDRPQPAPWLHPLPGRSGRLHARRNRRPGGHRPTPRHRQLTWHNRILLVAPALVRAPQPGFAAQPGSISAFWVVLLDRTPSIGKRGGPMRRTAAQAPPGPGRPGR
jgi:hypothetical protein